MGTGPRHGPSPCHSARQTRGRALYSTHNTYESGGRDDRSPLHRVAPEGPAWHCAWGRVPLDRGGRWTVAVPVRTPSSACPFAGVREYSADAAGPCTPPAVSVPALLLPRSAQVPRSASEEELRCRSSPGRSLVWPGPRRERWKFCPHPRPPAPPAPARFVRATPCLCHVTRRGRFFVRKVGVK